MRRIADDFRPNAASITILDIGAGLLAAGAILAVAGIPGADGGSQTLFLLATVAALAAAVVGFLVNLRRDGNTLLSTGIPFAALACAVGVVVNIRRLRGKPARPHRSARR